MKPWIKGIIGIVVAWLGVFAMAAGSWFIQTYVTFDHVRMVFFIAGLVAMSIVFYKVGSDL